MPDHQDPFRWQTFRSCFPDRVLVDDQDMIGQIHSVEKFKASTIVILGVDELSRPAAALPDMGNRGSFQSVAVAG